MVGTHALAAKRMVLRMFPVKAGLPDWHLTVSNNHRRSLNKQINDELHNTEGGVWIDAAHQVDGQGFWCSENLRVVGCATDHGVYNGQLYTVVRVSPQQVRLHVYNNDATDNVVDLSLCNIRAVRPAHAITYYNGQGRTLRGRVRLYVQHPKITTTHVIVGLSRAVCPSLIDCA